MNLSVLLVLIAVVLFVWSAGVAAGAIAWGTYHVLVSLGLGSFAASFLPWAQRG